MTHAVPSILATYATPVLAHQGGWDEILLVAGPIAVIIGLLAIVKRRIDARLPRTGEDAGSFDSPDIGSDAFHRGSDRT